MQAIDNDRCPTKLDKSSPVRLRGCLIPPYLGANLKKLAEGSASCNAVLKYLRRHDPVAAKQLGRVLRGHPSAPKSLVLRHLFGDSRAGKHAWSCPLGERVRELVRVWRSCNDTQGGADKLRSHLLQYSSFRVQRGSRGK